MARYLSLITLTDKGISEVAQSLDRARDFSSAVTAQGGRVLNQYWALGDVDGCVIFECPDDKIAASLLLKLGQANNARTSTMRVFDSGEFESIVSG